jgi:sec-independent protein translocase protein TatA
MGKVEGLLILLAIIMLFFGAKKLPELARGIGESARELKKGLTGDDIVLNTTSTVEKTETTKTDK